LLNYFRSSSRQELELLAVDPLGQVQVGEGVGETEAGDQKLLFSKLLALGNVVGGKSLLLLDSCELR